MTALPEAAFLLFLEAAAGGTIALFWVHLRREVSNGFTVFTGGCFVILGALAIWLRSAFPPLSALALSPASDVWFTAERWLMLAFELLLVVYVVVLFRARGSAPQPPERRNGPVTSAATRGPALTVLGLVVPLLALASLWSAALVDPSPQLFGLGAPLALLAGALALGSALAGLSLGHWYLVSPGLSVQPLIRLTFLCLGALLAQVVLLPIFLFGPGVPVDGVRALLGDEFLFFVGVRIVFGLLVPIGAAIMTWRTARIRSLDSATGLLYIVAAMVLAGEIAARALFFLTGVAT